MSDKKIWIELPKVKNFEQAKIHCDLANQMLEKLGVNPGPFRPVETQRYTKENTFYNCSFGRAAGFTELEERGTWFDLEYLARGAES